MTNPAPDAVPTPMRLPCEKCGTLHIDVGRFATKPHHTHTCQNPQCGLTWRPAIGPTVGVRFLPGFQNDPPATGNAATPHFRWRLDDPVVVTETKERGIIRLRKSYSDGSAPGIEYEVELLTGDFISFDERKLEDWIPIVGERVADRGQPMNTGVVRATDDVNRFYLVSWGGSPRSWPLKDLYPTAQALPDQMAAQSAQSTTQDERGQQGPTAPYRPKPGDPVREKRSGVPGIVVSSDADAVDRPGNGAFVKACDQWRIGWVSMHFLVDELIAWIPQEGDRVTIKGQPTDPPRENRLTINWSPPVYPERPYRVMTTWPDRPHQYQAEYYALSDLMPLVTPSAAT